jgi:exonuclease SbcC
MRIHAVRTQNLNSLHGEQELDLERDLARHALFLIRGDTGAGKSTILDAISLALFARTARLDGGSKAKDSVGERDPALVLSDGTSRARAEVDFSVLDGGSRKYWRARWSVARARGRADGNLQRPERTLIRLDAEGHELETLVSSDKEKDTRAPFDAALCGLTWDDFSRTVVLSQGQFQLFLRSTPKERAELLERLTGTGEYAEIGARAARRRQEIDAAVTVIETRIGEAMVPAEAELADLDARRVRLEAEERDLDRREADLRRDVDWLRTRAAIEAEVTRTEGVREAARAACAAFAEGRERLSLHRRGAPAAAALAAWRAAEANARTRTAHAADAGARLAAARDLESTLATNREGHLQALNLTEQRARADEPLVSAARRAWAALDHARKQRDDATSRCAAQATSLDAARLTLEASAAVLAERQAARRTVADDLLSLEGSDALVPLLPQWRGWLSAWQKAEERVADTRDRIDREAAARARGEETLAVFGRRAADACDRQARAVATLGEAETALEAVAGGADGHAIRDDLRRARTLVDGRRRAVERIVPLRKQAASLAARAAHARDRGAAERSRRDGLVERIVAERAAVARHTAERDRLRVAREQMLVVFEIAARRGALAAGEPCPLCGSLEHPYRDGAAVPPGTARLEASRREIEGRLAGSVEALEAATESLRTTTADAAAASAGIDILAAGHHDADAELERLRGDIAVARADAAACGLVVREDADVDEIEAIRAGLAAEAAAVDASLDRLEAALDAVAAASEARARSAEAVATATKEAQQARSETAAVAARIDQLARESAAADDEARSHERHLREAIGRHRWIPLPVEESYTSAADSIAVAEDRLGTWRTLQDRHRLLDGEVRTQEPIVERDRAARETLAEGLSGLDAEVRLREEAVATAERAVAGILDGRHPDTVVAESVAAIDAARCELAASERDARMARIDLEREVTAEGSASREAREAAGHEEAASRTLAAAIEDVGLVDLATLERAVLPVDEVRRLAEEEQAVDGGLRKAEGGVEAARVQLRTCLGSRPATLATDTMLDGLHEALDGVAARRRDVVSQLGEIRTTVNRAAEEAGKLERARAELAEGRREADRWKLIDDLIGTVDGARFRRLAQGYHLIELADFANLRLAKLSDRYRLRVALGENGIPTMDFLVQDSHHADRERPLTTLSGGETFLVSLALALALADFRAVRMPIETVLIDEGFGTLDPVTLNVVVQALENLQTSTGARVGIISHVSGLAERIGGRVLVERIAAGRSRIVVEVSA